MKRMKQLKQNISKTCFSFLLMAGFVVTCTHDVGAMQNPDDQPSPLSGKKNPGRNASNDQSDASAGPKALTTSQQAVLEENTRKIVEENQTPAISRKVSDTNSQKPENPQIKKSFTGANDFAGDGDGDPDGSFNNRKLDENDKTKNVMIPDKITSGFFTGEQNGTEPQPQKEVKHSAEAMVKSVMPPKSDEQENSGSDGKGNSHSMDSKTYKLSSSSGCCSHGKKELRYDAQNRTAHMSASQSSCFGCCGSSSEKTNLVGIISDPNELNQIVANAVPQTTGSTKISGGKFAMIDPVMPLTGSKNQLPHNKLVLSETSTRKCCTQHNILAIFKPAESTDSGKIVTKIDEEGCLSSRESRTSTDIDTYKEFLDFLKNNPTSISSNNSNNKKTSKNLPTNKEVTTSDKKKDPTSPPSTNNKSPENKQPESSQPANETKKTADTNAQPANQN
jgi:hypothetical protein